MLSRFFKDSILYAASGFLTRGLSFLLLPLYTRLISPGEYGAFDLLLAFGTLVNVTVALEISQALARFYNDQTDEDARRVYASTAFYFTAAAYTVFLVAALVFRAPLAQAVMGRGGFETVFVIGMFNLWGTGLFNILQNIFRADLQSKSYAVMSFVMAVATALLSVLFAYFMDGGLVGIVLGMTCGTFIAGASAFYRLQNVLRFSIDLQFLKKMLRFSLPLVPSSIAVIIAYYIDRVMIRHYLSLEDVGIYGIAFRIASITSFIMAGFQTALLPLIYTHYREKETPQHLATIFRFFIGLALVMFLGLSIFAPEILQIMTTPDYYSAAPIVAFLAPAVLLSSMYIFAPGTAIANKTHMILWINVTGAVLNIGLNMALIPLLGIVGACAATLINYACVFALYTVLGQRLYPIPYPWKICASATGVTIILVLLGTTIHFGIAVDIIIKLLVVVLALFAYRALGLVTKDELASLRVKAKTYLKP